MPISDNVVFEFKAMPCHDEDLKENWGDDEMYDALCSNVSEPFIQSQDKFGNFFSTNQTIDIPDRIIETGPDATVEP